MCPKGIGTRVNKLLIVILFQNCCFQCQISNFQFLNLWAQVSKINK